MYVYEAVRIKLGKEYPNVFYQMTREDKDGDVGIFLYESSNDLRDIAGGDVYNSIKVHIQINAPRSADGLVKAIDYLTRFVDKIENTPSNIPNISFIEAVHIGPKAVPIGRNKFDILVCKCDIDLKYVFNN